MAFSHKTFRQKYRVFSAAFWQNNGSTFDLEKSDKIVLPPSALNALTDCNASFPVLLKTEIIDSFTNKALPSNMFNYVIDYSAPEGLIYMSSCMRSKLNLDQSGQSVLELSLPTTNNLKYQCPTADFLQLQPHSLQLMLLDNITNLVHKSLADYYSSLRVNDVITIYDNKNNEYKLTVQKISGKDTSYTPKCVRLLNSIDDNLMLGFSEPKSYQYNNKNNKNDKNNKNNKDDQKKQSQKKDDEESDGEWEIVSVEKVKSLSDLEWKESDHKNAKSNQNDDDAKIPPQQPLPPKKVDIIKVAPKKEEKPKPKPISEPISEAPIQKEPIQKQETSWKCSKCSQSNDLAYKFCPKCGSMKKQVPSSQKQEQQKKEETISEIVLKKISIINDGAYDPSEDRQTGWIVKNISSRELNVNAKVIKIGGDSDVQVKYDSKLELNMKPNDENFILVAVKAPPTPNQYHMFYQLVLENDENKRICDMLNLPVLVRKQFSDQKENKIKIINQMGFSDRKKVVEALKKWNWDECKAINWLATH